MPDTSLFQRLRERKLVQWGLAYVAAAWLLLEILGHAGATFGWPEAVDRIGLIVAGFGFLVVLVLAWYHGDMGKQRISGPELLIIALLLAIGGGVVSILRPGEGAGTAADQDAALETIEVPVKPTENRVAVLPLDNLTGDSSLDRIGILAAEWVTDGVVRSELVQVVPFTQVLASSDAAVAAGAVAPGLAATWPQETGATLAITGSFSSLGDSIQFRLRIIDRDGAVLGAVDPVMGAADDFAAAFEALQVETAGALAGIVDPGNALTWSTLGRHPPTLEAQDAFLEGARAFVREGSAAALEHYWRAVELDPDYLTAYLTIVPMAWNIGRYAEADSVCQILHNRSAELVQYERWNLDLECPVGPWEELQAARRLAEIFPTNWYRVGFHALDRNRPHEAVEAFGRYDPTFGSFAGEWASANYSHWTIGHHMLGEYDRELELVREAQEMFPDELKSPETRALIALGQIEGALEVMEERLSLLSSGQSPVSILDVTAMELDAHGEPERARLLWERGLEWLQGRPSEELDSPDNREGTGTLLLRLGRNEEARPLVEALATEDPESLGAVGRLGVLMARLGDQGEANRISEVLRGWEGPFLEGAHTAWRARIAAASGDFEGAAHLLGQASEEGWNIRLAPHRDSYFKPLRGHPAFEEFMRPKG